MVVCKGTATALANACTVSSPEFCTRLTTVLNGIFTIHAIDFVSVPNSFIGVFTTCAEVTILIDVTVVLHVDNLVATRFGVLSNEPFLTRGVDKVKFFLEYRITTHCASLRITQVLTFVHNIICAVLNHLCGEDIKAVVEVLLVKLYGILKLLLDEGTNIHVSHNRIRALD